MLTILFDIDGTLLRCGPQVRPLFLGAVEEVFGRCGEMRGYRFAGKTDPMISREILGGMGVPEGEIQTRLDRLRDVYVERLAEGLDAAKIEILPGVVELLERLSRRRDVLVGLLTGNWRRGAEVKLARCGLDAFFAFGAFGGDGEIRRDLVPVALERASRSAGRRVEPRKALIVGDSPLDVDCARHGGVPSLAVATGFSSEQELREAGADWVFADLTEAGRELELFTA